MNSKPAKFIFQTECRCTDQDATSKNWMEDNTTGIFADRDDAVQDCLEKANRYPKWQYRVVRFVRFGVEVFK